MGLKMPLHFRISLLPILILVLVTSSFAGDTTIRNYVLLDHGQLQVKVPALWSEDVRQPPNRLPPTITFTPRSGEQFQMLITPIWPSRKEQPGPTTEAIKRQVNDAAAHARLQALEKIILLKELNGVSGKGYYFSATDRAPGPGEYKYLTQGALPVGDLLITFTILTNNGQQSAINSGIELLKSAVHLGAQTR
jgi:hypothetical protein